MTIITNKLSQHRAAEYQSEYPSLLKGREIRPSSASGGLKPQILLKITSQKYTGALSKNQKSQTEIWPLHSRNGYGVPWFWVRCFVL